MIKACAERSTIAKPTLKRHRKGAVAFETIGSIWASYSTLGIFSVAAMKSYQYLRRLTRLLIRAFQGRCGEGNMLQVGTNQRMPITSQLNTQRAGETLDELIDLVNEMLPVSKEVYPDLPSRDMAAEVSFCLHHSALHFSKTAGKLAAFVEGFDHGNFAEIETLQSIIAASLVNSLKLAEEIGVDGSQIVQQIKCQFDLHDQEVLQKSF